MFLVQIEKVAMIPMLVLISYIYIYIYINDSLVRLKVRLIVAYPRRPGFRSVPFPSMAAILNRWL